MIQACELRIQLAQEAVEDAGIGLQPEVGGDQQFGHQHAPHVISSSGHAQLSAAEPETNFYNAQFLRLTSQISLAEQTLQLILSRRGRRSARYWKEHAAAQNLLQVAQKELADFRQKLSVGVQPTTNSQMSQDNAAPVQVNAVQI